MLLLAVPGSGKTTVLVTRLGYMLCCCGIAPDQILTMTYTRAAAGEMKQRFAALFGQDCPPSPGDPHHQRRILQDHRLLCPKLRQKAALHPGGGRKRPGEAGFGPVPDLCGEYPTQSVVKELRKSIAYAKI